MRHDENTKEKIIEVAIECFGELGYEGTSMRLIAEKSGISKPAIYYHFPDKEKLFCGIVESITDKLDTELESIKNSDKNTLDKLKDFMLSRFRPFKNRSNARRFMTNLFSGGAKLKIPFNHKKMFERQEQLLLEIIQQGIAEGVFRPDINIKVFIYAMTGTLMLFSKEHFLNAAPPITEELADQILAQFINGVGVRGTLEKGA